MRTNLTIKPMTNVKRRSSILILLLSMLNLSFSLTSKSQCAGNFGEPVISVDFGTGTGYNPIPTGANYSTNLQYASGPNQIRDEGMYTITNLTMSNGAWLVGQGDHTGNPNGMMFLVNASVQPDIFFEYTAEGLAPGQAYNFSAWMASFVRSGLPSNVKFSVINTADNTDTLAKFETGEFRLAGDATSLDWKKYGAGFVMPAGVTSVRLVLSNLGPGGNGNDLVIDDIAFSPVGPCISIALSNCSGGSFTLTGTLTGIQDYDPYTEGNQSYNYDSPVYQWQFSNDGENWSDVAGANNAEFNSSEGEGYYRLIAAANTANLSNPTARIISNAVKVEGCLLLPVTFDKINATFTGGKLNITWATFSETNNDYFDVEVSTDGKEFKKIGTVKSKAENGNSGTPLNYEYTTTVPGGGLGLLGVAVLTGLFILMMNKRNKILFTLAIFSGVALLSVSSCSKQGDAIDNKAEKLFVRLKQVDKDGTVHYSKVIEVVNK